MNTKLHTILISTFSVVPFAWGDAYAGTRIGGGIHYQKNLGEIKDSPEFDENAVGFMGSILFAGPIVRLEADLEIIPDYLGTDKTLYQPQAYALFGNLLYVGAGIGIGRLDGDWQSDPFYALRLGLDFAAGGPELDLFTSYRFQKTDDFNNLGSDDLNSITFGALLRFGSVQ